MLPDELLKDAKLKLDEALGCNVISKSSVAAAKMMLETATAVTGRMSMAVISWSNFKRVRKALQT